MSSGANDIRTRRAGAALIGLGVLHTLATLGGAGGVVIEMLGDGWWRTADVTIQADPMHVAVFWSLQFGAMLALMGWLLWRAGRGQSPAGVGWAIAFGAVSLVGGLAVPIGGFWLGLGLAIWLAIRSGTDPA